MWLMILELFEMHYTHKGGCFFFFFLRQSCILFLFGGKNQLRANPELAHMKARDDVQSCTLGGSQAATLALISFF